MISGQNSSGFGKEGKQSWKPAKHFLSILRELNINGVDQFVYLCNFGSADGGTK